MNGYSETDLREGKGQPGFALRLDRDMVQVLHPENERANKMISTKHNK